MSDLDLEARVREALARPCRHNEPNEHRWAVWECDECLPVAVARALEAAVTWSRRRFIRQEALGDLTPDEQAALDTALAKLRVDDLTGGTAAPNPPTLKSLHGIAPNLTGGVESAAFVRARRAREGA